MKTSKYLLTVVASVAALLVILIPVAPTITGRVWPAWTGLAGKTLWDFAQLVIVPISLAVIAYLFSNYQRIEDRNIASEQRKADYEIALNREREEALQAYLSAMT